MSITDAQRAAFLHDLGVTEEQFLTYEHGRLQGHFLAAAALTLLFYDYLLTAEQEWNFVWKPKPIFSWAKVLFALNRYIPLATVAGRWIMLTTRWESAKACSAILSFTAYGGILNFACVEIVLFLRVWALYDRAKVVGYCLLALYLCALAGAMGIKVTQMYTPINFVPLAPQSLTVCKRSVPSEVFWVYGIGLILESVVFILLCRKAVEASKKSMSTPILKALLTHGVVYYGIVCAALATTMISPFFVELYQPMADANFIVAITSVACNRLILSLRGLAFSKGPIKASDMFGTSTRERHESSTVEMGGMSKASRSERIMTPSTPHYPAPPTIVTTSAQLYSPSRKDDPYRPESKSPVSGYNTPILPRTQQDKHAYVDPQDDMYDDKSSDGGVHESVAGQPWQPSRV